MQKNYKFKSGLRLIVNTMQGINSTCLSVFVNTGSVNENDNNNGISHFIEHCMFKGTKTKTAKDIAVIADELGANINAFTTNFYTCYYTRTIPEYLENCFELLSDMLNNSLFAEEELNKERKVILEEKSMYEDDPATVCEETCTSLFYKGTPMQRTIIGTTSSLHKINQQAIKEYMSKYYTANNIIISVAGNIDFNTAKKLTEKYFNSYYSEQLTPIVNKNLGSHVPQNISQVNTKKNIEQDHICIMFPTPNIFSERLPELNVFNTIFGGMMSSRLYQRIREKLGYVYTIQSLVKPIQFGGDMCIYFATNHQNTIDAVKQLNEEIQEVVKNGISQQELEKAKSNYKSIMLVKCDNPSYIANNSAVQMFNYGKLISPEKQVERINKLTLEKVNKIAKEIFKNKFALSVVSSKKSKELTKLINN